MIERSELNSGRRSERGRAAGRNPPDSLKIEQEIEVTLSQMRTTLDEIQENLSPQRVLAPVKAFLASPVGKALITMGAVTLARRRPFLAAAAVLGAMAFLYRGNMRGSRAGKYSSSR